MSSKDDNPQTDYQEHRQTVSSGYPSRTPSRSGSRHSDDSYKHDSHDHSHSRRERSRDYDDRRSYSRREDPEDKSDNDGRTIHIAGLPSQATEEDLNALYSKFGHVTNCSLIRDPQGISRRFAFITFETVKEANDAVSQNLSMYSTDIHADIARRAAPHKASPGHYKGIISNHYRGSSRRYDDRRYDDRRYNDRRNDDRRYDDRRYDDRRYDDRRYDDRRYDDRRYDDRRNDDRRNDDRRYDDRRNDDRRYDDRRNDDRRYDDRRNDDRRDRSPNRSY